ncbi:MAG: helix-turn-helix domain-containing protein [Candidatus Hermodarchaeota archaeon]
MVGMKIPSEKIEEIVQILGLTEEQAKTYLALISLGSATLGQISILSGLDYIQTQDALQLLIGSKLVKRISGKVGRYIALEPFLKSFLLAYDPITLVNIRKESSNAFEIHQKQLTDTLSGNIQIFQNNTRSLEADFSQSLTPVKGSFAELTGKLRGIIKSSGSQIQENIEKIQTRADSAIEQSNKLNENILKANISKVKEIPNIFQNNIPAIKQELAVVAQTSSNDLENYKNGYKTDLDSFKNNLESSIINRSKEIDEALEQFERNRSEEKEKFKDKILDLKRSLQNIRIASMEKKSNFQIIRQGYKEIDNSVSTFLKELDNKLNHMEPLITNSISDIQSRKLFKGKDEFLGYLSQIEEERLAVHQLLNEQIASLEKISSLNSTLNETEVKIVEATETGIQNVEIVLNEEVRLLSNEIDEIKQRMSSDRTKIQTIFDTTKESELKNINGLINELDQKIEGYNQHLRKNIEDFLSKLTDLIQNTTEDYKNNLRALFSKEEALSIETSDFTSIKDTIEGLRSYTNSELKTVLEQVLDVEEAFNTYFNGLNTFTRNFADTQLETFISALNEVKEIVNSQGNQIEQQVEQEVSALVFSIKEMKQKLSKISEIAQLVETSDIEPSLLSSDLVVGEPVIIMLLRDLTVRTKASLTILMPRPELQTLIAASKLPMRTRVTIIGDFKKVPKSTLKKVLSAHNVRLKQLSPIDFWGCIRDSEELLVCPEPKDPTKEDLLGVITTNENLVELFSQELMTYTTRSREISPQDLD